MSKDEVKVTNVVFICASCGKEVYSPKRGCENCGSKKHIPKIERNLKEEKEINEIVKRAKKQLNIKDDDSEILD